MRYFMCFAAGALLASAAWYFSTREKPKANRVMFVYGSSIGATNEVLEQGWRIRSAYPAAPRGDGGEPRLYLILERDAPQD